MKDKITKSIVINFVLWLAFALALGSSVSHLAWTFGTLEAHDRTWMGWVPAIAVDAGLAALAYSIQQRKRAKPPRPTLWLWVGVAVFALISALANLYHALSVESSGQASLATLASVDWLMLTKAIVLSATLPGMVLYLGEIVSSDDGALISKQEQEAARARAKEEREQRRSEQEIALREQEARNEERRLELAIEQARAAAHEREQVEQVQASLQVVCNDCGRSFKNRQAKAAHKCEVTISKNGSAQS